MSTITVLLDAVSKGDQAARDQLFHLVYNDIRDRANQRLAGEHSDITFSATDLVHEIYLKLFPGSKVLDGSMPSFKNSRYFYGSVARAMEQILIDHSRKKKAEKHGGGRERKIYDESLYPAKEKNGIEYDQLAEALEKFKEQRPIHAEIVYLHHFLGFKIKAIAQMLEVSESTVEKKWAYAKAWLGRQMTRTSKNEPSVSV